MSASHSTPPSVGVLSPGFFCRLLGRERLGWGLVVGHVQRKVEAPLVVVPDALRQALVVSYPLFYGPVEPLKLPNELEVVRLEFISLILLSRRSSSNAAGFYDPFECPLRMSTIQDPLSDRMVAGVPNRLIVRHRTNTAFSEGS